MADPWAAFPLAPQEAAADPWAAFPLADDRATGMRAERSGNAKEGEYLADALRARYSQDRSGIMGNLDAAVRGAAGWVPGMDKLAAAGNAAFGSGQGATFGDRYADNLMRERAMDEADKSVNPYARFGGQAAGLVGLARVSPALTVARGFGLGAQSANAAATGAAYGGASGAIESDGGAMDKLKAGSVGAGLGFGLGGAAPGVIRGAGAAYDLARQAVSPAVNMARGLTNPEAEAVRRVTMAMARDKVDDPAGALAQMQATGAPAVAADAGGETVRALARSAANNNPEAREGLTRVAQERFHSQGERLTDKISGFGVSAAGKTLDDLHAAARSANNPAYKKAYTEGGYGVWNDRLAELAQAPAVREAMQSVVKTGANKTVVDGMPPVRNPFTADADGNLRLMQKSDGSVAYPNLQFWDYVQRNLRGSSEQAARGGNKDLAGDFTNLRRAILDELDTAVPSFGVARAGAARAFGAEDALEAGQKFVMSKMRNEDAQKALMRMSPPERELFATGFRSDLIAKIKETGDSRNVVNAVFGSEAARQRVKMAMGPQQAGELEATVRAENAMDMLRGALGNSTTARQLVELGLASGAGAGVGYYQGGTPGAAAGAVAGAAIRKGKMVAEDKVAFQVGKILASDDAKKIGQLIKVVARQDKMMAALKRFEDRVAKIAGIQAGEASTPLQVSFGSRVGPNQFPAAADDQDPKRPRVGQ